MWTLIKLIEYKEKNMVVRKIWEHLREENPNLVVNFNITSYFEKLEKGDYKSFLDKLYEECRHGDDEHQKWLKDKFEEFYKKEIEV